MLIAVAKTGNIGSSTVLELLLDERADRRDIEVRVISSLYTTPNASAPGPKKVIEGLSGKNAIVVSDGPAVKAKDLMEEKGLGYILVKADAMIGARREFLAGTGVIRLIQEEVGKAISAFKEGDTYLPRAVVTGEKALDHASFKNAGAREKALKAFAMAEEVGQLNVRGCFIEKEPEKYIQTVAKAHEILKSAAEMIDEAREEEKQSDTLYRTPHSPDGKILRKHRLLEKPR
jgi:methylenetetrahydromethanopterin dehydrogenase